MRVALLHQLQKESGDERKQGSGHRWPVLPRTRSRCAEHLVPRGIGGGAGCSSSDDPPNEWFWNAQGGATVFAPFKHDTDYFAADKAFMINLRVENLDALVARLEARGIAAERRAEWDDPAVGRFARIHDPEGNAIELWEEPAG
jgi:catechol 2,3-dioxygenase-like lactoylglutathione lyase family enzyme